MPKGTIFFDYDGTLHDSMRVYGPAFRCAVAWLEEQGYLEHREYEDEWISHWLGWTTVDMWTTFAPDLPEEVWRKAAKIVGREMDARTGNGEGALFPGVEETLRQLKDEGWTIALLSNCRHAYRDAHRRTYGLDRWFSAYHCAEDFPDCEKWEIYKNVADTPGHPRPHIIVGDRFHDMEVAQKTGISSVGCSYGFGLSDELACADAIIHEITQLPRIARELTGQETA